MIYPNIKINMYCTDFHTNDFNCVFKFKDYQTFNKFHSIGDWKESLIHRFTLTDEIVSQYTVWSLLKPQIEKEEDVIGFLYSFGNPLIVLCSESVFVFAPDFAIPINTIVKTFNEESKTKTELPDDKCFNLFNKHMKMRIMISDIVTSHDKLNKELTEKFLESGATKSRYENIVKVIKHKNMKFKIWIGVTFELEKTNGESKVIYKDYKLNIAPTTETRGYFEKISNFNEKCFCSNSVIFTDFANRMQMEEILGKRIADYFEGIDEFMKFTSDKLDEQKDEIKKIDDLYHSMINIESDDIPDTTRINVILKFPTPFV